MDLGGTQLKNARKLPKTIFRYLYLCIIVFLIDLPVLSMLGTSFKTRQEVMSTTSLLPSKPTIQNFAYVMQGTKYSVFIFNSFSISLITGLLCVGMAALAGYALSRFRGKIFSGFSTFLLMIQMFPLIMITIPLFIILRNLRLIDTIWGVILLYTTFFLPFSIWMFKSYFDAIPYELEESAQMDGAGRLRSLVLIVLPIAVPAVSTIMIFVFILCWNEFLLASLFLKKDVIKTISLGMQLFFTQYSIDWASVQTAATIASLPAFVFILIAQKYLVRGMSSGALKG